MRDDDGVIRQSACIHTGKQNNKMPYSSFLCFIIKLFFIGAFFRPFRNIFKLQPLNELIGKLIFNDKILYFLCTVNTQSVFSGGANKLIWPTIRDIYHSYPMRLV